MLFSIGRRLDFEKYKQIRNRVVPQLHRAKFCFIKDLTPRSSNKTSCLAVKYLNKMHNSIPVLNYGGVSANTNQEKVEILNSFFSTCFNRAMPSLSPCVDPVASMEDNSDDLLCTIEDVWSLLSSRDVSIATGPDGISPWMLKTTAEYISPSVTTKLFNLSLQAGYVPNAWKQPSIVPIPSFPCYTTE